jgi:hypothetical protein
MVTGDFRPYLTNGYWDYSDQGWIWMSNYSWGWAPFHYGRWLYDDLYGWLWVPGYEWSPAWVTWGMFDDYYAWAPLLPEVNVGYHFNNWHPSSFYWNVCNKDHIYDRDIYKDVVNREMTSNFANRIDIINNFGTTRLHNQYYDRGPDVLDVQKYTVHRIESAKIRDVNNSGITKHSGNEIEVYRPSITNPQPREFRRIENNTVIPLRTNNDESFKNNIDQQRQNIDRLPVSKAPENIFRNKEGGNYPNRSRTERGN